MSIFWNQTDLVINLCSFAVSMVNLLGIIFPWKVIIFLRRKTSL